MFFIKLNKQDNVINQLQEIIIKHYNPEFIMFLYYTKNTYLFKIKKDIDYNILCYIDDNNNAIFAASTSISSLMNVSIIDFNNEK